jgi:hypothetical protein
VGGPYPSVFESAEAPNPKLQAPKKHQAPNTKQQIAVAVRAFGA